MMSALAVGSDKVCDPCRSQVPVPREAANMDSRGRSNFEDTQDPSQ